MELPFKDELISNLIFERHYFCAPNKLRPLRFKKTREGKPYRFYGEFEKIGWHPLSWRDAASKNSKKKKDALSAALREEVIKVVLDYRIQHPICEKCGLKPSEETHHKKPTWKEIITEVIKISGDKTIEKELSRWDWFKKEKFRVDPKGRMKTVFHKIHDTARLEALCKPCHKQAHRRKKTLHIGVAPFRQFDRSSLFQAT